MTTIRINDLARELGIRSRMILNVLPEIGVASQGRQYSSSLKEFEVTAVRAYFMPRVEAANQNQQNNVEAIGSLEPTGLKVDLSQLVMRNSKEFRQSFVESGPFIRNNNARRSGGAITSPPLLPKEKKSSATNVDSVKPSAVRSRPISARTQPDTSQKFFCSLCKCYVMERDVQKHANAIHSGFSHPLQISAPRTLKGGRQVSFLLPKISTLQPRQESPRTPLEEALIPCAQCGIQVFPAAMKRHIKNFHTARQENQLQNPPATRLPFILLPPGVWEFRHLLEHNRKRSRSHPHGFFEQVCDWDRITQIKSLNGELRYFGMKAWFGYAVYEFPHSHAVVLECPVVGNAAYVISGDWKEMICLTKAEHRCEYANQCVTVVHKGEWLHRISQALKEL